MPYVSKQDLIDELGENKLIQLTDQEGDGVVNDARVDKALSYAIGTFDSYARTRYTIPVPVTEKVKSTCLDLAVFHLYKRATTDEGVYKVRKDAHDEAMKFLRAIGEGKAALDVPTAEETVQMPANPDRVLKGNTRPVFTDQKLEGW